MGTGFEEDDETIESGEEKLELTEREKAIAEGRDPEGVGTGEDQEVDAEAEDTEVDDKDADASDDGKDAAGSDWITDDIKELADSYELDEETLGSFESEQAFRLFASVLEKHVSKEAETKPPEEKQPEAKEPESAEDVEEVDVSYFEQNGYDEPTVKLAKAAASAHKMIRDLQARLEQSEQRITDVDRQRELEIVNREIDELGGRFGNSDSLTSAQQRAREKLLAALSLVDAGVEKLGGKPVSRAVKLRRAELLAFPDEVLSEAQVKQREELSQKVKKQSAKRRPVGRNTKPSAPRELPGEAEDPVKAIAAATAEWWYENARD